MQVLHAGGGQLVTPCGRGVGRDELRYAAARQALLASGRVVVGAGRGGNLEVVG